MLSELEAHLNRNDSMNKAYPLFCHLKNNLPITLKQLSLENYSKIIGAVALNLRGISESLSAKERASRCLEILRFMQMLDLTPEFRSFELTLFALSKCGNLPVVEYLIANMRQCGYGSDEPLFSDMLMRTHAVCGNYETAMALFEKSLVHDSSIATYNKLIMAFLIGGNDKMAEALVDRMKQHSIKPNNETYEAFAKKCVTIGDFEGAGVWIKRCADSGVVFSTRLYDLSAEIAVGLKNYGLALKYIDAVRADQLRFSATTHALEIVALAGIGDRDRAWRAFGAYLQSAKPSQRVLRAMAALEGPLTPMRVAELDKQISEHGLNRRQTLNWLITGYSQIGDPSSTLYLVQICEAIENTRLRVHRLNIVMAYIKSDNVSGAIEAIDAHIKPYKIVPSFNLYLALLDKAVSCDLDSVGEVASRMMADHPDCSINSFYETIKADPERSKAAKLLEQYLSRSAAEKVL
eukprot:jgi/Hompol1/2900/HPOL_006219-RA